MRLAPNHHLVPSAEGWLLFPPDGSTLRLKVDVDVMERAAHLLAGRPIPGEMEAPVRAVLEQFADRGFARASEASAHSPAQLAVSLVGDGAIADRIEMLLETTPLQKPARLAAGELPDPSGETDIVVACAGWLPDAAWRRLDAWCLEHGVAWHSCYAEGRRFYLGPYASPSDPSTPTYRDVRDRRLAAEFHPNGLEAHWRYLDLGERVPPVSWPDEGNLAVIAGTLVSDLLAVARGERPPSHGHQLAFDPTTGEWRRHPVLPVPRGLMTESLP